MTLDLTGIAIAVTGGIFSLLGIFMSYWISQHLKDKQAADTLGNAVHNALGALEQASAQAVLTTHPHVELPGVPVSLQPGVQYVLDHAGEEADRFGITPQAIAGKLNAQIGLAKLAATPMKLVMAPPPALGPMVVTPAGRPVTS